MNRAALFALAFFPLTASAWTPSTNAIWNQALPWQMNSGGSSTLTNNSQVESIFIDSYDEWTAPACTNFAYSYNGTTNRTSNTNGDGYTVHGFLQGWPNSYGDPYSVIGITLAIYSGSRMNEADVSFNEAVYTFVVGQPRPFRYEADLQSIATHEFGHSLGLGHTQSNGATMFPSYDNGTATRSIANDDINGVCALYPSGNSQPSNDDQYEPNNTSGAAAQIGCGDQIQGTSADEDWFVLDTTSAGDISLDLDWSTSSVDLDLYLYDTASILGRSENENTRTESVAVSGAGAGRYYILIVPYAGSDDYTLSVSCAGSTTGGGGSPGGGSQGIDDTYEDNDEGPESAPIDCPATIDGYAGDQDWFEFTTSQRGDINASLTWRDGANDLDLYITNEVEVLAESISESGTSEQTTLAGAAAGTYRVVVNPYGGADEYRLQLTCGDADPSNPPVTDTDDASTDSGEDVEPGDPNNPEKPVGGCACSQGTTPPWWLALLPGLLLASRRRH